MNKKLIKRIIIVTVVINVVIFLFIGGKITFEKTKEAVQNKFSEEFSKNIPKFPGGELLFLVLVNLLVLIPMTIMPK